MSDDLYFETHIFCCVNERPDGHPRGCCKNQGAEELRNYMKEKTKELGIKNIRVNNAGCLDRCECGPTMVIYPRGTWYHYKTRDDIDEIIEQHLINDQIVDRLELTPKQKRLRDEQQD